MNARITSTGNEGFHIAVASGGAGVYIDAFWEGMARWLGPGRGGAAAELPADLILVTHAHWDHFSPSAVAAAAQRSGAIVAGPAAAAAELRRLLPKERIVTLEPPEPQRGAPAAPVAAAELKLPKLHVTAFRTSHGRGHNSYLVDMGGFRLFHDGDNEDTRPLDVGLLAPVDALLLCPWKGSGWVEFIERLAPRKWFLMHLSEDEIDEHLAGRFLPELCDHVPLPDRIVALRPGESYTFEG